ncbi:hypothetical protein LCGC14_0569790 [marine sediment metagenome]|uniref:Uncharacterized protein n=1 Tax=marine sediment metagenome TaxID=412755 RepID=A0A0F9S346_9ZZZZ
MKNKYNSGQIMIFLLAWLVFIFGGLYTHDWINKVLVLVGSGFLAGKLVNWCWKTNTD